MKTFYRSYRELCKIRVALLSAFSAAVGSLLTAQGGQTRISLVVGGVFFLACGSLVLNQYQERDIDAAMPRTCLRPIPSGRVKPLHALPASLLFLFAGFFLLSLTGSLPACALGLVALVCYNGLYTPLKRITAFAAIPGALVGAITPAIGWIAAGGEFGDPRLLVLCFFFFIWQVPHSWLLLMRYGREYEEAGIPSMTRIFSVPQLGRIIFNWILATAVSCLFLSVTGLVRHPLTHLFLLALSLWLAWTGIRPLLCGGRGYPPIPLFRKTNYYLLSVLFSLSVDTIVWTW